MDEFIDSKMWLTRGSSVIFDKEMLGPLLNERALISLRQAMAWLENWPAETPHGGKTVLVGGLDTVLEVLPPDQAEEFVRTRIRPLIREFQDRWDGFGLVFGLNVPPQRLWEDPVSEKVYFINRDEDRICLATELWNGSAITDMRRLMRSDGSSTVRGGYYAPRS